MIRLNLTATPEWLDLAPGLRLLVAPLTTALMVSARADPAIESLPEGATQEELALAMAKAVARRAVLDWEGVGDEAGLGGQLRVIPGAVLGWDMGAALAMARALGIDTLIAAELLPEIEAVMVRKLNEQMEGSRDG